MQKKHKVKFLHGALQSIRITNTFYAHDVDMALQIICHSHHFPLPKL